MQESNYLCVTAVFGNISEARFVAKTAVSRNLCACAQILPPIESYYVWSDELFNKYETMVAFKTEKEKYADLESLIKASTTYVVSEIVALPIVVGEPSYLNWIHDRIQA